MPLALDPRRSSLDLLLWYLPLLLAIGYGASTGLYRVRPDLTANFLVIHLTQQLEFFISPFACGHAWKISKAVSLHNSTHNSWRQKIGRPDAVKGRAQRWRALRVAT
jgi:hypothetical protein